MAFTKEKINDLKGIILMVILIVPVIGTTNIDCKGKPFHCVNSTHFMICVDIGGGFSSTIDNYVIPCPPTTVCQGNNRFECEFPPSTVAPSFQSTEATTLFTASEILAPKTSGTTITPSATLSGELLQENFNTVSITTLSENRVIGYTTLKPPAVIEAKENEAHDAMTDYSDIRLETTTNISNITGSVTTTDTKSNVISNAEGTNEETTTNIVLSTLTNEPQTVNSNIENTIKSATIGVPATVTEEFTAAENKDISELNINYNIMTTKPVLYEAVTETINKTIIINNLQPKLSTESSTKKQEIVTEISDMNITKDLVNAYELGNFSHIFQNPLNDEPIYSEKVILTAATIASPGTNDNTTEEFIENFFTTERITVSDRETTVVEPIIKMNDLLSGDQGTEIMSTTTSNLSLFNESYVTERPINSQLSTLSMPLPSTVIETEPTKITSADTFTSKSQNIEKVTTFQNGSNILSKDVTTSLSIETTISPSVLKNNNITTINKTFSTTTQLYSKTTSESFVQTKITTANLTEQNIANETLASISTTLPSSFATTESPNIITLDASTTTEPNMQEPMKGLHITSNVESLDLHNQTELSKLSVLPTEKNIFMDSTSVTEQNIIQNNKTNKLIAISTLYNDTVNVKRNDNVSEIPTIYTLSPSTFATTETSIISTTDTVTSANTNQMANNKYSEINVMEIINLPTLPTLAPVIATPETADVSTFTFIQQNTKNPIEGVINGSGVANKDVFTTPSELPKYSTKLPLSVATENILSTGVVPILNQNEIQLNSTTLLNDSQKAYNNFLPSDNTTFSTLSPSTFVKTEVAEISKTDTFNSTNTDSIANMITKNVNELKTTEINDLLSLSTLVTASIITTETANTLTSNISTLVEENTEQSMETFKTSSDITHQDFTTIIQQPEVLPTTPLSVEVTENILSADTMVNTNKNSMQLNKTNMVITTKSLKNDSGNSYENIVSTLSPIFSTAKISSSQLDATSTPSFLSVAEYNNASYTDGLFNVNETIVITNTSTTLKNNIDHVNQIITEPEPSTLSTLADFSFSTDNFNAGNTGQMDNTIANTFANVSDEQNISESNSTSRSILLPIVLTTKVAANELFSNKSNVEQNTETPNKINQNGIVPKEFTKQTEPEKISASSPIPIEKILSTDNMVTKNQHQTQLDGNANPTEIRDETFTIPEKPSTIPPLLFDTKQLHFRDKEITVAPTETVVTIKNVMITDNVATKNQNTIQVSTTNPTIKLAQNYFSTASGTNSLLDKLSASNIASTVASNIISQDNFTSASPNQDTNIITSILSNSTEDNFMESNLTSLLKVSSGTSQILDIINSLSNSKQNINELKMQSATTELPLILNSKDVTVATAENDGVTITLLENYTTSANNYDNILASNVTQINISIDVNSSIADNITRDSTVSGDNITKDLKVETTVSTSSVEDRAIRKMETDRKGMSDQINHDTSGLLKIEVRTITPLTMTSVQNSIQPLSENSMGNNLSNKIVNIDVTTVSDFTTNSLSLNTFKPDIENILITTISHKGSVSLNTRENSFQNQATLPILITPKPTTTESVEKVNSNKNRISFPTKALTNLSNRQITNINMSSYESNTRTTLENNASETDKKTDDSVQLKNDFDDTPTTQALYTTLLYSPENYSITQDIKYTTAATDTVYKGSQMEMTKALSKVLHIWNTNNTTMGLAIAEDTSNNLNSTYTNTTNEVIRTIHKNPYSTQEINIDDKSTPPGKPDLQYYNRNNHSTISNILFTEKPFPSLKGNNSVPENTTKTLIKESTASTTGSSLKHLNVANQNLSENTTPLLRTTSKVKTTLPSTINKLSSVIDETDTRVYSTVDENSKTTPPYFVATTETIKQGNTLTIRTVGERNYSMNTVVVAASKTANVPIKLVSGTVNGTHEDTVKVNTINIPTNRPNTAKSHFICPNSRGRYADNENCRKFYICFGKHKPIVGKCPEDTVFSEIRKQCTNNLSHCIRNKQFYCTTEGRFSDYLRDNIYYICVKTTSDSFVRFKLQCLNGYHLNKTSVRCVQNTELSDTSNSDSSKNNSDQSTAAEKLNHSVSKSEFECKEEGKFADSNDSRKYYVCSRNNRHEFRRKIKKCESEEIFHVDNKKCVEADSYERK